MAKEVKKTSAHKCTESLLFLLVTSVQQENRRMLPPLSCAADQGAEITLSSFERAVRSTGMKASHIAPYLLFYWISWVDSGSLIFKLWPEGVFILGEEVTQTHNLKAGSCLVSTHHPKKTFQSMTGLFTITYCTYCIGRKYLQNILLTIFKKGRKFEDIFLNAWSSFTKVFWWLVNFFPS